MEKLRTATNILVRLHKRTLSSFERRAPLVQTLYLLLLEGMHPDTCSDAVLHVYKHMDRVLLPTCDRNCRKFCLCFFFKYYPKIFPQKCTSCFLFGLCYQLQVSVFPGLAWCVQNLLVCHPWLFLLSTSGLP